MTEGYWVLRYKVSSGDTVLTDIVRAYGSRHAWMSLLHHRHKDVQVYPVETIYAGMTLVEPLKDRL